jgi:hypothetical protein
MMAWIAPGNEKFGKWGTPKKGSPWDAFAIGGTLGNILAQFINHGGAGPTTRPTGSANTGGGSGGGYGGGGGGSGLTDEQALMNQFKKWAQQNGYRPSASIVKMAVKGEWTLEQFARMARFRDTTQWMKSAMGKKEIDSITATYRKWFPTWAPTLGFLKGLYRSTKGMALTTPMIEEYIRTRPEFKDIYRYYITDTSGFNVKSSPDTYRQYLDEFRNIYRSYMGEFAPESEIKFFFESRGLTPEQYKANVEETMSTGDAYQRWEGVTLNDEQMHAALYNRKGGAQWRSKLVEAANKREKFMKSQEATVSTRFDEQGKIRQVGI